MAEARATVESSSHPTRRLQTRREVLVRLLSEVGVHILANLFPFPRDRR